MPLVTMFEGCGIAVEDIPLPDGSKGKSLTIIDQAGSKQVFRYLMDDNQAKIVGQNLLGSGVVVPDMVIDPKSNGKGGLH